MDAFCAWPGLAQLRYLSLQFLNLVYFHSDAIRRGLAALRQVHTLQLLQPYRVDDVLPLVSAAPSLTQLRILCLNTAAVASAPSAEALHADMSKLRTSICAVNPPTWSDAAPLKSLVGCLVICALVERVTVRLARPHYCYSELVGPNNFF